MIRTKLVKALLLGACFSLFSTGVAYAQSNAVQSTSFEGVQSEADTVLYEKQSEIDKYVFEDHAKDIEAMGFSVTNTGVMGDVVEVGILPFEQAYADFLYETFGDNIKVVEGHQNILFAGAAPDSTVVMDNPVSNEAEVTDAEIVMDKDLVTTDDETLEIQITSAGQESQSTIVEDAKLISAPVEAEKGISTSTILYIAVGVVLVVAVVGVSSKKAKK